MNTPKIQYLENGSNQYVIILSILFFLFLTFTISYTIQSQKEVQFFSICTNTFQCLFELTNETQNPHLCDLSSSVPSCYLTLALEYNDFTFCNYSPNSLSCIISFSIENKINYCNIFYSSNSSSAIETLELKKECIFNFNHHMNIS